MVSHKHNVISPITGNICRLVKNISPESVTKAYLQEYDIDVTKYFPGTTKIAIYECPDTGYKFYYPFSLEGQADLYEQFQQFDWYYMPWKWEHELALQYIQSGNEVLEVGSGFGGFLKGLRDKKGVKGTGLELNPDAVSKGNAQGLDIRPVLLDQFSTSNSNKFDVVCSFQVLEHVADVRPFFEQQIECLKPGGYLITAVPNNDSFINDSFNILNLPPHHMGLWDKGSLDKAGEYFGLKLLNTHFSPLEDHHRNWYFRVQLGKVIPDFLAKKASGVFSFLDKIYSSKDTPQSLINKAVTVVQVWQKPSA